MVNVYLWQHDSLYRVTQLRFSHQCHGQILIQTERDTLPFILCFFNQQDNFNIILVDWSEGSMQDYFPLSASTTRTVGADIALVSNMLTKHYGMARTDTWCVGHSLGAHTCGHAGMRRKFGRVSGTVHIYM